MSESPKLSIVTPAYNESKTIEKSLDAIREQAVRLEVPYEIVVIDDGSSDDTWLLLGRIAQRIPELRALPSPSREISGRKTPSWRAWKLRKAKR